MTNEIIYQGLVLGSDRCKYFQVKQGDTTSLVEDPIKSTLTLTFSPGSTPKDISLILGLRLVGSGKEVLRPMSSPVKFRKTYVTLNGLKLEKLTYDPHIINIVIVGDSESRVVQTYEQTVFVINQADYENQEFIKFLFYSGNLLYLKPVGQEVHEYKIRNFPKIQVGGKDLTLESESTMVYSLRREYNDYLIRGIDYQERFLEELKVRLEHYGVDLVRLNKETTLSRTSYVTYQFNQTPIPDKHPRRGDYERYLMDRKQSVEFALHTADMVLYHDFKDRYLNVMLLTNFTEYKTPDKSGDLWTAAVKWSGITEDFNHVYQPDDNSNFSFQCQFRCELFFHEVLDRRFEFLSEINILLNSEERFFINKRDR